MAGTMPSQLSNLFVLALIDKTVIRREQHNESVYTGIAIPTKASAGSLIIN